jgi:MinD-like ATPase involved in chromosome partitioning or flagellar assembly
MIEIAVVDSSAEARNQLADRIIRFQSEVQQKSPTCPQLSVRVLSLQELPFAEQPDVCVIGGECLSNDLVEIATVRTHMPDARLIADCPADLTNLVIIEQMGRLGVDDIINQNTSAEEFFRKLVLLSKRVKKTASGKLIAFDSGKGGVGVTSVVSATATTLFNKGLKVAVVDLDSETQDLTRFLSVRPVINENLAAMLSQERAVVKEFVEQAVIPIWGNENLVCVPPVLSSLQALPARSPMIRVFLSFLEQLDHLYDVILVDIAGIRGGLYSSILRVADSVIFVTNPEPASMFATTQVVKETLRLSPHPDAIRIVQNSVAPGGMFSKLVNIELLRSLKLNKSQ